MLCCYLLSTGRNNVQKENKIMKKETIVIFTANTARRLLKDGFTITDIKPDKTDPDGKRSVFVFKNEDGLLEKIKEK